MSFFRYPGGKSKLREKITKKLSVYADQADVQYREPFFGGGSIGLKLIADNKKVKKIWINDKDIGIACLWTAVIKYHEDFKICVKEFTPSVTGFHELRNELTLIKEMPKQKDKIIDIGFKKLAIHQISYSGLGTKSGGPLGGEKQQSKYKIDCRWSPDYICKKIDKLYSQFSTIEIHDNECSNLDFCELIKDITCDSFLYMDPPYYLKGNDLYQCGFTVADHKRLALALEETKHAWVLSYDDCQEVRDLYKWAYVDELNVNYSITALKNKDTGERLSRNKTELLVYPKHNKGIENYVQNTRSCYF